MFRVGQKVVCIKDSSRPPDTRWQPISLGQILTIRQIEPNVLKPDLGVGLFFLEIKNPLQRNTDFEYGYYSYRFRPVVERKTDISALTALLNPANHKSLENV